MGGLKEFRVWGLGLGLGQIRAEQWGGQRGQRGRNGSKGQIRAEQWRGQRGQRGRNGSKRQIRAEQRLKKLATKSKPGDPCLRVV